MGRKELAEWWTKFDWEIWFTGTFKQEMSYRDTIKTKRAFERVLHDVSDKFNVHNIEYALAVERFQCGNFTHVHSLVNGLYGMRYVDFADAWRNRFGRCRVEGYDKEKGAAYYLTKYVTKELCDWDLHIDKRKSYLLNLENKLIGEENVDIKRRD